ncbi:DUF6907 domain-containing protein [Actinacidiphila acidipaludis]|uniref:Uncharacterized protein n=1 Tax=Actinacidiphila acidipaludis TaxID=2873382 RepID=A0ABS7Q9B0_9ACTN|nr:hypothetical protein [Streptomyces acidipaludis]MBY8879731.1 hypothetical protein [Streptomyces acidipaludis]
MTARTVSIETSDHGTVEVPEPAWCTGAAHPDGVERDAIAHTGPTINVMADTERGPRRLLELLLWADAFPTPANRHGDAVYVAVQLLDGDYFGYDVTGLDGLAADLLEAAGRVRYMARRLAVENRGGDR